VLHMTAWLDGHGLACRRLTGPAGTYALPEDSALRGALLGAADAAGLNTTAKVAGPSNIGNFLAGLGIPATAGFGVDYRGLHGTDERIRLDSVPPVQAGPARPRLAPKRRGTSGSSSSREPAA
jgi:acetylornithine deacetylase/succinyl-diaminopimelate desuccinylase-like protein